MINRWIKHIIFSIPGGVGNYVRCKLIKHSSKNIKLFENGWIEFPSKIFIGNGTSINRNFFINAYGNISVGNNVLIGPYVTIYSTNHIFADLNTNINQQGQTKEKVVIEDDVWIGAHAIILPGVKICKGAIVGAGAIVTKDVESNVVVAGSPAKKINNRQKLDNGESDSERFTNE